MTLNLLLGRRPPEGKTVILADPGGASIEPALAGLISQLGEVRRVIFPLPDETTRRHVAPPSRLRGRHADLWHALSEDERARALLVAGPTAAYLAPVLGPAASTVVAVHDPREPVGPASGAWRSVLGPFPELDEVSEEAESEQVRERWLDRIRTATSRFELVRAADVGDITGEVAARVGLGPKASAGAAKTAAAAIPETQGPRRRDKSVHWLDEALYSLSRPPEGQRPRQRRRRRAESSGPPDGSPKMQRSRKRRRR